MNSQKKILISAPTSESKKYCFEDWLNHILSFKYSNYNVVVYDNSVNSEFTSYMNRFFIKNYGTNNYKFQSIYSGSTKGLGINEKLLQSSNHCREYFLSTDAQYYLSLETDVFPPADIISELLCQDKDVIGALYDRDEGKHRKLCIQSHKQKAPKFIYSQNMTSGEEPFFVDGTIKEVASVGLGCVLVKRHVIEKIPFRIIKNSDGAPDMYFSEDCFRNGIKIYAHTGLYCEHRNKDWGLFGITYK